MKQNDPWGRRARERRAPTQRAPGPDRERRGPTQRAPHRERWALIETARPSPDTKSAEPNTETAGVQHRERQCVTQRAPGLNTETAGSDTESASASHRERRGPTQRAPGHDRQSRGPTQRKRDKERRAPTQRALGPDTARRPDTKIERAPGPDTEKPSPDTESTVATCTLTDLLLLPALYW